MSFGLIPKDFPFFSFYNRVEYKNMLYKSCIYNLTRVKKIIGFHGKFPLFMHVWCSELAQFNGWKLPYRPFVKNKNQNEKGKMHQHANLILSLGSVFFLFLFPFTNISYFRLDL